MDQGTSTASNCYYFLPWRPFLSAAQAGDGPRWCEWAGGSPLPVLLREHLGPALEVPGAGSCSRSHPRASPGKLLALSGPAAALPPADPPGLVRPAASCLAAPTFSTTCLLRGRVENGASASQNSLSTGSPSQPCPPSWFHPRPPSPEPQLSSTFPSSWCYELPHFFQNPTVNLCSHIPLVPWLTLPS